MTNEVFIFCNGDRHPGRDEPVTTFVRRDGGDWYEKLSRREYTSDMVTLDGDLPSSGRGADRIRWEFSCPVCKPKGNVVARRETLLPRLDMLLARGIPHVSLIGLAAIL